LKRKPFGRNQVIAIAFGAGAFVLTLAFSVVVSWFKLDTGALSQWIGFVQVFTPAMVLVILGPAAAVKRAEAKATAAALALPDDEAVPAPSAAAMIPRPLTRGGYVPEPAENVRPLPNPPPPPPGVTQ
jgi:hypothetical protein